ncbi:PREDICTED: cysteine-rich secretory protein 1 [Galeopterus variegatus]|uniref:Cysteine-rich secretory protein 1 n=1 Tax=Galeopterus variegatus TaxID=482537 RepID=A0ABM0RJC6_GALVR|nr:PREDICTED: cysteine-rich secretory protein 1 [Galeopterus variegatus]
MAMKYFLFLAAATAGFGPVLARKVKPEKLYNKIVTELPAIQEEIVNLHNTLRRGVVPSASNMLKMSWSKEAEQNARIFSRYCDMSESNPLERRLNNTFCGENMHLTSYPFAWTHIIGIWYNESKYFKYGEWTSTDDNITTDHYTQVVWATSYLIGCAVASCREKSLPRYLYVCHYCHEGNEYYTKNLPYKTGAPCEECPNNCEDKLCTNPCVYYDELINCTQQAGYLGCKHPSVKLLCKATCLCDTEIK